MLSKKKISEKELQKKCLNRKKKKEGNEAVGESESVDVLECYPRQESAYKISVSWYILREEEILCGEESLLHIV